MTIKRFLMLMVLLAASNSASAAYYAYRLGTVDYPTALLACASFTSDESYNYTNPTVSATSNPITYKCFYTRTKYVEPGKGTVWQGINAKNVNRIGDGCQPGTVFNQANGSCDAPPESIGESCGPVSPLFGFPQIIGSNGQCVDWGQLDKAAACKYLGNNAGTQAKTVLVTFDADGTPNKPSAEDKLGCELSVLDVSECKMPAMTCTTNNGLSICSGSSTSYCKVGVSYTGEVSQPDNGIGHVPVAGVDDENVGVCPDTENCETPDLPVETEQKPCVYVTDGEGRQVCSSSEWEHKPGQNYCGYNGSTFECITKKPTSNGIVIGTEVKTETNPDGKTTTTKTDTLNETKCIGAGSCTTQTTTNKTTIVKNGAGETESASGSCTGPACPDKNTNPDGDGDGFGDCTGDDCKPSDEEYTDTPMPELDEVPGFGETTTNFINGALDSPIPSTLKRLQAPSGGDCPVFSGDTGFLGTLTIDSHCQVINGNQQVIKLIAKTLWALLATWILVG